MFRIKAITLLMIFVAKIWGQPSFQYVISTTHIENANTPNSAQTNNYCIPDSLKGFIFAVSSNFSKTTFNSKTYDSKDGIAGVFGRFKMNGSLLWSVPYYGAGVITQAADKLQGSNAVFSIVNNGKTLRIGNDSCLGSYSILSVDTNGKVAYLISLPLKKAFLSRTFLKILPNGNVASIIRFDSTSSFLQQTWSKGVYCVQFNQSGQLVSKVKLGYCANYVSSGIIDLVADDSFIYYHGMAVKGSPFLGNDFIVRAIDSNSHLGANSVDQFLACVNYSGKLQWLHKADTMSLDNQTKTLAITKNGRIFWSLNYYKTGIVLGRKLVVKFKGYGYSYLVILNKAGGLVKEYYNDTVGGGEDNVLFIQSSSDYKEVIIKTVGKSDAFLRWKLIPDSVKSIVEATTVIRLDTSGNWKQFNSVPISLGLITLNTYCNGYGLLRRPFSPSESNFNYAGSQINNISGNDYAIWNISLFKPKVNKTQAIIQSPLIIYPNPADRIFYLGGIDNGRKYNLHLYNLQGQLVSQINGITAQTNKVDVSNLPSGLYSVQMEEVETHRYHVSKLMIQR